ncbi:hypothetical protein ZWY2020_020122 [Hordeum vulgare]|nr:hypothetical protein ZWY2020_020122 [Hordeum vulgare]
MPTSGRTRATGTTTIPVPRRVRPPFPCFLLPANEGDMESHGVLSQRFSAKHLCAIAKSKLNPRKRKYVDETGFGDIKNISPFTVPHDLMAWLAMNIDTEKCELRLNRNKVIIFIRDMVKKVFNIPSGNRTVEFYKRHEQCDLPNIYHKTGRAPTAHTVDVLYKVRNDDVDTTKRSWVLLALATILTPDTGNMVPLECLKSLEKIDKVIYMDHLIFPQAEINEHQLNYSIPRDALLTIPALILCGNMTRTSYLRTKPHSGSLCGVQFRPLSDTPYVALPPEGRVTGIVVGNSSTTTQDVDCDDTQGCGAEDVNINGNQDEVAAEDNPIEDVNPMENGKSVEEDVFGSLDDWLENRVPFGVDPEHIWLKCTTNTQNSTFKCCTSDSFVQVLQGMHCRRMAKLLKDVHLVSSSNQQAKNVTFDIPAHRNNYAPQVDERGGRKQSASTKAADEHAGSKQSASTKAADEHAGSKQTASTKAADEQITHKVMVEPVEGAQSICYSRSADETNGGNVVYLRTETSVDYNQDNAEKEQVSSGKDVSHGPQLGASVGGHWSDAPSMSLFQEGTKEWWIGVPSAPVDSNSSSPGNIAATPKSCAVFDATPQDPDSAGIKVHVYDGPTSNHDEDKERLKDEKKVKSKKRAAGPKYKKIKTNSKTEKSLKPRAQMCNEVMSLFIESFNFIFFLLPSIVIVLLCPCLPCGNTSPSIFSMSIFVAAPTFFHPEVFDPSVCAKELMRACQNFQILVFDLLFFTIVRDGHWIVCVVNLLHKKFNLFDSLDNGNLNIAARKLFTNFKRITDEGPDFTMDLNSFKPDWPEIEYSQQSTHFDCGYFEVLYIENFDGNRMKDFKKVSQLLWTRRL